MYRALKGVSKQRPWSVSILQGSCWQRSADKGSWDEFIHSVTTELRDDKSKLEGSRRPMQRSLHLLDYTTRPIFAVYVQLCIGKCTQKSHKIAKCVTLAFYIETDRIELMAATWCNTVGQYDVAKYICCQLCGSRGRGVPHEPGNSVDFVKRSECSYDGLTTVAKSSVYDDHPTPTSNRTVLQLIFETGRPRRLFLRSSLASVRKH